MSGGAADETRAPYLDAVAAYVDGEPDRFHVPGHKGGPGAPADLCELIGSRALHADVPQELQGIDVGPEPTPFDLAESLAARAHGAARTWFLTNGATQGNHALCLALARDQPVVVQRNSHASVVDGLVLSGGRPLWVAPQRDDELGMALCVTAGALADALARAPGTRAALIVSPTYYGAVADVAGCARVAHAAGAALVVDQAWGPHFGFHPALPAGALTLGADAVLTSTHKIVGSLTQSAMLHVAESPYIDVVRLARAVRLVRSTSPSSLLMASLDASRRRLACAGQRLLSLTLERGAAAREKISRVPGCAIVGTPAGEPVDGERWSGVLAWDPLRIVIDVRGCGHSGHAVGAALRDVSPRVEVELATHAMIVLVLGVDEPAEPLARFPSQLTAALERLGDGNGADPARVPVAYAPEPPTGALTMSPREAWIASARRMPIDDAVGRISAESIAGYPPGIPALLPGESITAEMVEHLRDLVRAGVRLHGASDPHLRTIETVDAP